MKNHQSLDKKLKKIQKENKYEDEKCTCKLSCEQPCKGECGCKACYISYQDFLSTE